MSIYECIDEIEKRLFFVNNHAEKELLEELKTLMYERERRDNYLNLAFELKKINDYKNTNELSASLNVIYNDIFSMAMHVDYLTPYSGNSLDKKQEDYIEKNPVKFLQSFNKNRIAKISFDVSYRRGNSSACYGFVFAMADKKISPYENPVSILHYNREIYNYQENQNNRTFDQQIIKQSRLTRKVFEPTNDKQAKQLLAFAKRNVDLDLSIRLRGINNFHRVYLRVQKDGKIRYMDSIFDAYLFEKEEDFLRFYSLSASIHKTPFHFYQICKLTYDPENALKESQTWRGKLRTLLTGYKYSDGVKFSYYQNFLYPSIGASVGIIIGGVLGAMIGSILPVYGIIFGALLGGTLLGVINMLIIGFIQYKAYKVHHFGLLSIPHYLKDCWYNFKHPQLSESNQEQRFEVSAATEDSSSRILKCLGGNLNAEIILPELPLSASFFSEEKINNKEINDVSISSLFIS